MGKKVIVDCFEHELTAKERGEIEVKAKEITDEIFGAEDHEINGPKWQQVIPQKKKPGRPKKATKDHPEIRKREELPELVRDVITEKIDLLERMITAYDEDIDTLRIDLEQQIRDLEDRKKDAEEKIRSLIVFMGGE